MQTKNMTFRLLVSSNVQYTYLHLIPFDKINTIFLFRHSRLLYKFAHQFYKPNVKTLLTNTTQVHVRIQVMRHHHLWRGRGGKLSKYRKGLIFFFPFCKSFTKIQHARETSIKPRLQEQFLYDNFHVTILICPCRWGESANFYVPNTFA